MNAVQPGPEERFFVPGPTEVRPDVLQAMSRQMIFHRSAAMEALMERVTRRLGMLFGTSRAVHVLSGSGTAAMELAIRGGARRRVLAIVHGDFGERFARLAEACGRDVERLTAEPGDVVPPDRVRDALRAGSFDTVLATHSETATGVLADVAAIARIVREQQDCMLLVDAVSSAGGVAIETDAWGCDAVVSASQKAMALPPGLAFAAVSERLVARARTLTDRGAYLDVLRYEEFTARRQSPTTPAIPLLFALDHQLEAIERETLAARCDRHRAMAAACVAWAIRAEEAGLGVSVVAKEAWRSPTVTCLRTTMANTQVLDGVRARGYAMGGGQGVLARNSVRVGHMGDHTVAGVAALLEELEQVLRRLRER